MNPALQLAQLILAIILIAAVLIQVRNSGMGSALGGSDSSFFSARRGIDRVTFNFTIFISFLFFVVSALAAVLQ
jgi:protein translocase SecG subunit|tara:strand:+ start:424 stop:645 length:222 start_codon:yes stop_codon:yes gene_type:complete